MKDLIKSILKEYIIQEQRIRWNLDMVLNVAKKYSKMNDFKKNEPKAYGAARSNGWIEDVRKIMTPAYENWGNIEKIYNEASKYETLKDFRELSPKAYVAATNKNILDNLKNFKLFTQLLF